MGSITWNQEKGCYSWRQETSYDNLRPRKKSPRVWAMGIRRDVGSRTAFHWHRQVSPPDTCICLVLEKAGLGVGWEDEGAGEEDEAMLRSQRGKESWDFSLLFSNLQKSVSARPETRPSV